MTEIFEYPTNKKNYKYPFVITSQSGEVYFQAASTAKSAIKWAKSFGIAIVKVKQLSRYPEI